MRKIILLFALFSCFAGAGTISGNIIYTGGGLGLYVVVALSPEDVLSIISGSFDPFSLPRDMLFVPGPYEIVGDFSDGVPYTLVAVRIADTTIHSGDPMGMHPRDVYTFAGDAWDKDIELATEGTIGGHIAYSGNILHVKVNVYDMLTGSPILENAYHVGASDYSITIPSGFKMLEFFADLNSNNVLDSELGEPSAYYNDMSRWGPIVFSGGGGRFASGVDVSIPPAEISENFGKSAQALLSCSSRSNGEIEIVYSTPTNASLDIFDISGRVIYKNAVWGNGEMKIGGLRSGIYLVRIWGLSLVMTEKVIVAD